MKSKLKIVDGKFGDLSSKNFLYYLDYYLDNTQNFPRNFGIQTFRFGKYKYEYKPSCPMSKITIKDGEWNLDGELIHSQHNVIFYLYDENFYNELNDIIIEIKKSFHSFDYTITKNE